MQYPPLWLRRMRAPQPPPQPRCLVTGQAAQYRDPQSGQPYSSLAAFKRLKPQYGDTTPGAPRAHVPPPRMPGQVSAVARGEQSNRSKQVRKQLWVRNQGQPLLGQLASSMSLSWFVLLGAARTGSGSHRWFLAASSAARAIRVASGVDGAGGGLADQAAARASSLATSSSAMYATKPRLENLGVHYHISSLNCTRRRHVDLRTDFWAEID